MKKVTLICGDQKDVVSPEIAQSRLQIQKVMRIKGWELPEDSPYEFKDNALIKRTDTRDCKEEPKPKRTTGRSKSSEPPEVPHGDSTEQV